MVLGKVSFAMRLHASLNPRALSFRVLTPTLNSRTLGSLTFHLRILGPHMVAGMRLTPDVYAGNVREHPGSTRLRQYVP